jgi:hypothetical protein
MLAKSNSEKEKIREEAKKFTLARFTTAIHYVKQLYTKEEALRILEECWPSKETKYPYD